MRLLQSLHCIVDQFVSDDHFNLPLRDLLDAANLTKKWLTTFQRTELALTSTCQQQLS